MPNFRTSHTVFLDIYIAFAVDFCPCAILFTMIEPSAAPSAARAQAESSKKRNATAKLASKSKRQSTIAMSLLVPLNSTTSLSISKKGLPAPSASKSHAKVAAPADSNWVLKQFVDYVIVETQDDNGATIREEEKSAESFRERCLHCNKFRNKLRRREHYCNQME